MIHQMQVRIYYQDTDAGGIVYHSNYLDYAERARSEMLLEMGYSNHVMVEKGIGFVLRHVDIDYRKPARLDELLTVETVVTEMKNASLEMEQTVLRGEEVLVVMHLQLAAINPQTLRPTRMPEELKTLFLKYIKEK